MSDQLEHDLREAFSQRAAQLDPSTIARLRAIDYRPRPRRRLARLPALGALGATGVAAAVVAVVTLGSDVAPAFAGWQPAPTRPAPGQIASALHACGQGLGRPVLSDSRGPYTASIYADASTSDVCLRGGGIAMSASSTAPSRPPTGQISLAGLGTRDSAGDALTLVDGRTGTGVRAVTIHRSDGSSVQATVANGWYLAWWPGTSTPTQAQISTASGSSTVPFPAAPALPTPACPSGAHCASGYAFGAGAGVSGDRSVTTMHGGGASRTH